MNEAEERNTELSLQAVKNVNARLDALTLTPEQVAYLEACAEGGECENCVGVGFFDVEKQEYGAPIGCTYVVVQEDCDECHGSGRLPKKARVTLAFEEQPFKDSKFVCHGCFGIDAIFFNTPSGTHARKYPLPINATVEVRVVCDHCGGNWSVINLTQPGPNIITCHECVEGTIDTGLRLKTGEPWVGVMVECPFIGELQPLLLSGEESCHDIVASYECEVSKVEVSEPCES